MNESKNMSARDGYASGVKKIILFSILLLLPAFCLADFSVDKWQYYKSINLSEDNLAIFSLDDEIFSNAKSDLADLRIIDNNSEEAPYKMIVARDKRKADIFYPKMLNNSFVAGRSSSVVLDFEKKGRLVNQLRIITASENFQRNVIVYGSDNRENWKVLNNKAYIYDYTDKRGSIKTQNTSVSFPQSVYRYIKIEISDQEGSPVKISRVEAINYIKEKSKEVKRNPKYFVNQNSEERATEVIVDLGAKGIPTSKVLFKVTDRNFNRGVLVYTGNDKDNWKYNNSGYIFRYNTAKFTGENLLLNFSETNDQYIKIIIQNKDNRPINIEGLTSFSIYREVIFQAESGKSYRIYYGNKKARFPEYDLENYFKYLDVENAKEAALSGQQVNSSFVPELEPEKPLSERIPYLFSFVLVIASLILLFLVFKFFQKK